MFFTYPVGPYRDVSHASFLFWFPTSPFYSTYSSTANLPKCLMHESTQHQKFELHLPVSWWTVCEAHRRRSSKCAGYPDKHPSSPTSASAASDHVQGVLRRPSKDRFASHPSRIRVPPTSPSLLPLCHPTPYHNLSPPLRPSMSDRAINTKIRLHRTSPRPKHQHQRQSSPTLVNRRRCTRIRTKDRLSPYVRRRPPENSPHLYVGIPYQLTCRTRVCPRKQTAHKRPPTTA